MARKLIDVIDELTAIGNNHGFDTEVEILIEGAASGLVVNKWRDDSFGEKVAVRVGCVDVPIQSSRVITEP